MAAAASLGLLAAVPFTVSAANNAAPAGSEKAAAGSAVLRGEVVTPGKETPKAFKDALKHNGPVVVAFLLPGITEDDLVESRIKALQKSGKYKDTKFIYYKIKLRSDLGDLPEMFDVTATPAVAIIQSDDKLTNMWRGVVDPDIVAQSIVDARELTKKAKAEKFKGVPTGDAAGIALAKKVNAAYAAVPGVELTLDAQMEGEPVEGTAQVLLAKGFVKQASYKLGAGDRVTEMVSNKTGSYVKLPRNECWVRDTKTELGLPIIPMQGVRFDKPVKSKKGGIVLLRGRDQSKQYDSSFRFVTYTIDEKTSTVVSVVKGKKKFLNYEITKVKSLDKAPQIPVPGKVC